MLDPRKIRRSRTATLGAILLAAVVAKACSSEPKKPEPPSKTSPPMAAKGDTSTAKPAPAPAPSKSTEVAKAPTPAPAPVKKADEPKPAPAPVAPAPAPASSASKEPVREPAKGKEEPKPAPSSEFPPKPPVNLPEIPRSHDLLDGEAKPGQEIVNAPVEATPGTEPSMVPVAPTSSGGGELAPAIKPPQVLADEKILKALADEKRIEIQKRQFLAGEFTANGENAFRAMKYADAKDWALKALEQDGGSAPARDLLMRSRSALGERVSDVQDLTKDLAEMRRVKMEMAQEKARALYNEGRSQMGKENFDGAIRNFEDALTIIQQDPYGISWGDMKAGVEGRLREAKAARDRAAEQARRQAASDAYKKVKMEEAARIAQEEAKWRAIMDEAMAAYGREDFAQAEDLARQALDMRPSSTRARDLMNSANRARHGQTTEASRQAEKEEFRKWKNEMDDSMIPYSSVLTAPSAAHWDKISRLRRNPGNETGSASASPETEALRNRLAGEMTSFKFDGQTLSEAVAYLSARHNINIIVDEAVKADVDAQPLPACALTGIPLKDALDFLLSNVPGHVYRVQGNVVKITKPELARDQPVVRIHPVADLTMKINNFVAPNLILKPAGAEADEKSPLFGKTEEGKPALGEIEDLITLIKDNVGDSADVWANAASIDAHADSSVLVVAEPALQDGVARFLNDLRKFSGLVVNIEARFLSVSDNFLRDVGVDVRGLGGNFGTPASLDDVTNGLTNGASGGYDNGGVGLPANASGKPSSGAFFNDNGDGDYRGRTEHLFDRSLGTTLSNLGGAVLQWTLLDDTQLSVIWRAVEKKQEARILQSPNLTVYNTQRANITLINQLAFVQDFDVEVAQTAFIADPQVAIIQDGLDLDVKPVVSNDRRYVTLQLQPTIATLKRPIQTFTTSLGAFTTPVTLQLPEITIQKAQTTVRVPNGGTLLIGGLKNISSVDLKSETPFLSKIPLISFFFSRRGTSQEYNNLLIIIRARIADMGTESANWGSR